jgi:hypothetical protein
MPKSARTRADKKQLNQAHPCPPAFLTFLWLVAPPIAKRGKWAGIVMELKFKILCHQERGHVLEGYEFSGLFVLCA